MVLIRRARVSYGSFAEFILVRSTGNDSASSFGGERYEAQICETIIQPFTASLTS